jgi:hypothetical protein
MANKIMTEDRVVTGFDKIKLQDYGRVIISQGQRESLTVEADPDLFPDIRSKVVDNVLILKLKQDFFTKLFSFAQSIGKNPILYRIQLKELNELRIFGKFDVEAMGIKTNSLYLLSNGISKLHVGSIAADLLTVKINGRSEITVDGKVKEVNVGISGSGECQAGDLASQFASVKISGQGSAEVWAEELLDVNISGHGRVGYKGSPRVSQNISGSGSVSQVGD